MDRREAISTLQGNVIYACENAGFNTATISLVIEALDMAIEALEREIEYGQMVVDLTKGEKVDDWVYDEDESATTTDCISRADTIKALCQECEMKCVCDHDCTEVAVVKGMPSMSEEEVDYCNNCPYISYNEDCCIGRQDAIEAVRLATAGGRPLERGDILDILYSTPSVTPPKRVVAEIKVDTEDLVKRIKEEYQLEQEYGRLIDVDKLLQELFNVDEEEWTTPEIRAILENAPTIITPKEMRGEWIKLDEALLSTKLTIAMWCEREYLKDKSEKLIRYVHDGLYEITTISPKHGKWEQGHNGTAPWFVCSECQEAGNPSAKFCHNCGAKMKE